MTRNLLTEWSRLLVQSFAAAGVTDVVISPGSRSTPLAWAALDAEGLTCHTVIDERSAAFFAVGHAKVTGRPVVLICTSGSAVAHYLPAFVEAAECRTPVIALTADRPFELLDCAAPQAIDQTRLFGQFSRAFFDLGMPDAHPDALTALQRKVAQAVLASQHPLPGPVHLNVHARKPLEPVALEALASPTIEERALSEAVGRLLTEGPPRTHRPRTGLTHDAFKALFARLERAERGLLVVGRRELHEASTHREAVLRLAELTGLPVLLEAPSQLRLSSSVTEATVIDAIDGVVRGALATEAPVDFVLELGPPLTSGAWAEYVTRLPRGVRIGVQSHAWPDPQNSLAELVIADPWQAAAELVRVLEQRPAAPSEARRAFRESLARANSAAWATAEELMASEASGFLSEPAAVRALVGSLPSGSLLALGNSLAIREVDWVCPRSSASVSVWAQRGANGIDGLIAGATGAAHAARVPTCLLLGDVSALHDLTSLATARTVTTPLCVAVLDNDGGHIFGLLPLAAQAARDEERWRFWSTPPRIDWQAAARTFGARFASADSAPSVNAAVKAALAEPGVTLLRVVVEPGSAERFAKSLPAQVRGRLAP